MDDSDYLVSYGQAGDFGRFRPTQPFSGRRGDRVVIRSPNGLELGVVLCLSTPGHDPFLGRTSLGQLLRRATADDERSAQDARERGQRIFEHARLLARQLDLPLEVLDVEVLLDGAQAVVYHLCGQECDVRPLVSKLASSHDLRISLQNLYIPGEAHAGCGKPNCGQHEGGGCGTCGSGGGCSSCGKSLPKKEVADFLAGLRPDEAVRTPLL